MSRPGIDRVFERHLSALVNGGEPQILQGGRKGVEKESLRVLPHGRLAATAHPPLLGSALTSEHITTDYSEALIELVTPAFTHSWELLQYLLDLHQFVYRHLGDELLWATSMPCAIERDEDIPLAQYGSSHVGRMKTVYRNGLGLRYGRMMQAISGVHFNYSFPLPFWEAYAARRARAWRAVHLGVLLRPVAQLPPPRLAGAVPVRRVAGGVQVVPTRPRAAAGGLRPRHGLRALRHQPAHERCRLSQPQPGGTGGVGEQPRGVRARPAACDQHAPSALRGARRQGERRVPPAQRQHPADRERVLQLHPAQARGALRRAAHQGAAPRRGRIRGGARARRERLRSRGREPEQAALPRGVSRPVPAEGQCADRRLRAGDAG